MSAQVLTVELQRRYLCLFDKRYPRNRTPQEMLDIIRQVTKNLTRGDPTCSDADRDLAVGFVRHPTMFDHEVNWILYLEDVWYNGYDVMEYTPYTIAYRTKQFEQRIIDDAKVEKVVLDCAVPKGRVGQLIKHWKQA
jgi:hypothetical protein